MCRYANYGPYKRHFACFSCRKGFKRTHESEWPEHLQPADGETVPAPCPECRRPMADMGWDFKPPRQRDVERWAVVEFLYRRGVAYHSCGCSGPGYRPARWADVHAFMDRLARGILTPGEILAERFAARA